MRSLLITGFTGFIGSRLLPKINIARYDSIFCVSRSPSAIPELLASNPKLQLIHGDFSEPRLLDPYLTSCETVLHMAAVTGKAPPEQYFRVNAEGTRRLIRACERNKVSNFLYLSTIAVKYPDKRRYYYAQSKEEGERAVQESSLKYSIVRPTIVLGKDSPIWKAFFNLTRKRVLLVPGKGSTRIQPIYVEDLAECICGILDDNLFERETVELGGPEVTTYRELLERIHRLHHSKKPVVISVPLKPLILFLSLVEKPFYSILPVSTGQLSAFTNEGTIDPNPIFSRYAPEMKDIDGMLREVMSGD